MAKDKEWKTEKLFLIITNNLLIFTNSCTPVAIFGAFLITIFGAYSITDYIRIFRITENVFDLNIRFICRYVLSNIAGA